MNIILNYSLYVVTHFVSPVLPLVDVHFLNKYRTFNWKLNIAVNSFRTRSILLSILTVDRHNSFQISDSESIFDRSVVA